VDLAISSAADGSSNEHLSSKVTSTKIPKRSLSFQKSSFCMERQELKLNRVTDEKSRILHIDMALAPRPTGLFLSLY
jgi:hypothetical protein